MLKYRLTHPEILAALAGAGHGSQVLIADGNYPFSTGANPAAGARLSQPDARLCAGGRGAGRAGRTPS